jgi:hypothetical protein
VSVDDGVALSTDGAELDVPEADAEPCDEAGSGTEA